MHGAPGGRRGQVLPGARRGGRWRHGGDDRGPRDRRQDAPAAEGVRRARRDPVRVLYAGDGDGGQGAGGPAPGPHGGRRTGCVERQPVPLRRLPADHRRGDALEGPCGRRGAGASRRGGRRTAGRREECSAQRRAGQGHRPGGFHRGHHASEDAVRPPAHQPACPTPGL